MGCQFSNPSVRGSNPFGRTTLKLLLIGAWGLEDGGFSCFGRDSLKNSREKAYGFG